MTSYCVTFLAIYFGIIQSATPIGREMRWNYVFHTVNPMKRWFLRGVRLRKVGIDNVLMFHTKDGLFRDMLKCWWFREKLFFIKGRNILAAVSFFEFFRDRALNLEHCCEYLVVTAY